MGLLMPLAQVKGLVRPQKDCADAQQVVGNGAFQSHIVKSSFIKIREKAGRSAEKILHSPAIGGHRVRSLVMGRPTTM